MDIIPCYINGNEAELILKELNLLSFLNQHGEARVVGSVALDLIVKPDLDVHLLIKSKDLMPTTYAITEYLLGQSKIQEVRLTDWRDKNGIKIGIDAYSMSSGDWSIDIWVTNDQSTTAFEYVEMLNSTLSDKQRQIILEIKTYFHNLGQLRNGLSLKIYNDVLENGIKTVAEFLNGNIDKNK
jgi:hypothetical protein